MTETDRRIKNMFPTLVFAVGLLACETFELNYIPFMVGYLAGLIAVLMYQGGVK